MTEEQKNILKNAIKLTKQIYEDDRFDNEKRILSDLNFVESKGMRWSKEMEYANGGFGLVVHYTPYNEWKCQVFINSVFNEELVATDTDLTIALDKAMQLCNKYLSKLAFGLHNEATRFNDYLKNIHCQKGVIND